MFDPLLLIIDSKSFLMSLKLMVRYFDRLKRSPAFLKTGNTIDTFHRIGKHLPFRLNSFARIGDKTGMILGFCLDRWRLRVKARNFGRRDRDITYFALCEAGENQIRGGPY